MKSSEDGLLGHEPAARASYLAHIIKWGLEVLKPAYFNKSNGPRKPLSATAYLDGLRGVAAFMVYWHHHQLWPERKLIFADEILEMGFGYKEKYYFASLPVVRTFFTGGHFSVAVFFVISGYVLSAKPLALIHSKEWIKLSDNLSSAFFRRWIRLHLPVAAVTIIYVSSWHLFDTWTVAPKHQATYREELWNWYKEFKAYSFVFRQGGDAWLTYSFHTWSIPVEFRGSIIVYSCLLAFSRSTTNARLWCTVGLIWYFMYVVDGWFGALFLMGMLLGELDLLQKRNELPSYLRRLYTKPAAYACLVAAAFLSGTPSHGWEHANLKLNPGWYYLSMLKPSAVFDYKWFYLFWAATFLFVAIPQISWLKSFFESRFAQYLGRISYSLYLVHGPILWVIADRFYTAAGWYREVSKEHLPEWIDCFPLPMWGPLGFEPAFWLPHIIILPLTLWTAEVVTKLFDEPSVRFAQWAYRRTLAPIEKL